MGFYFFNIPLFLKGFKRISFIEKDLFISINGIIFDKFCCNSYFSVLYIN